jgi:K+ transporter
MTILFVTVTTKFTEGGWVTVVVTLIFVLICQIVRWHYDRVKSALKSLDDTLLGLPFEPALGAAVPVKDAKAPSAAIIVRDFDGIGIHTLLNIQRLFPNHFRNIIFVSVGVIDTGQFKGQAEIENLKRKKEEDLRSFVDFATCLGWYAEYRYGFGVDLIDELEQICEAVAKDFPRTVFFSGKLVFQEENPFTRLLHNHTPFTLQQKLQFAGRDMMILPIRVIMNTGNAAQKAA